MEVSSFLDQAFGSTGHVSWPQECARAGAIFLYGLACVRVAGRRIFGKWAALDIIVAIIIGSNLSRALTGSAPLVGTLLATTLLVALHWLLAQAAARWKLWSVILEGRAVDLGREGQIKYATMQRWAISEADLDEALRTTGVQQANEARLITLEPSGKISVLKRGDNAHR